MEVSVGNILDVVLYVGIKRLSVHRPCRSIEYLQRTVDNRRLYLCDLFLCSFCDCRLIQLCDPVGAFAYPLHQSVSIGVPSITHCTAYV